jgi:hypothetical protein
MFLMTMPTSNQNVPRFVPVSGDGFVISRPSSHRIHKKREFHKLAVAHSDIRDAHEASVHLLKLLNVPREQRNYPHAGMDHPLYRSLVSAIVVSYAKPFTQNEGFGVLKKKWTQFAHPKWNQCHARVLKARHEMFAHSDAAVRVLQIHPPGKQKFLDGKETEHVGFSIRGYMFTHAEIETLADLTYDLGGRIFGEVERLLEELYAGLDLPNRNFLLRFDNGL